MPASASAACSREDTPASAAGNPAASGTLADILAFAAGSPVDTLASAVDSPAEQDNLVGTLASGAGSPVEPDNPADS